MSSIQITFMMDLADNGTGRPVDRGRLASQLRAGISQGGDKPVITTMAAIACAVESGTVDVHVSLSAEQADRLRLAIAALIQKAIDDRKPAADLCYFRRAWERQTGWRGEAQVSDRDYSPVLGSGYR